MKLIDRLQRVLELEKEAHRLYDDACSNLAYGNLSKEMRNGYVQQTYKATELHARAMGILRDMAGELGYHLD